jgi:hypothetical protein
VTLTRIDGREESPFCFDHYGGARHHGLQLGRTVFSHEDLYAHSAIPWNTGRPSLFIGGFRSPDAPAGSTLSFDMSEYRQMERQKGTQEA